MRRLISSGSPFEAEAGYSRAVVDGEWIFVAGTTGFDYAAMTIAEDPCEQTRQAFRNIEKALSEAGAGLPDVVRVRYYVPDIADWPESCRCSAKSSARSALPRLRSSAAWSTRE